MTITMAAVQMTPEFMDRKGNLAAMAAKLETAAAAGARLAVFPEAAVSGYCYETAEEAMPYAESVPGDSAEFFTPICRKLGVFIIYGTLERRGERLHNSAVLVGPDGFVGVYRKTHLPYLGMDRFTTPGSEPYRVHDAGELKIGMLICYDGAFPEATRCLALAGADVICLPTNWPPGSECSAEHVSNARAMENNVYFAAVNRVGTERGFRFIGGSRIVDPSGKTLASADRADPAILYAEIDPARARRKYLVRVPGKHSIDRFADRRPDLYGPVVAPVVHPRRQT